MTFDDLNTIGYIVVPNFLSARELNMFRQEFARTPSAPNMNYSLKHSAIAKQLIGKKVMDTAKEVSLQTNLKIDMLMEIVNYTSTEHLQFGWHQDHESQYVFQQSLNHLNFFIPIIKPDSTKSGLSLVSLSELQKHIGNEASNFIGTGAKKFYCHDNATTVVDDESGKVFDIPVNLDSICETPNLSPGDLLLVRGDIIHKTQDVLTNRVAISVRAIENSVINKSRLFSGCDEKMKYIENNKQYYDAVSKIFEKLNTENVLASDIQLNKN